MSESQPTEAIFDPPHPRVGALLAWLFPGAGHLYQGRTAKGLLYMACLVPMFAYGFFLGGGKVAFASTAPLTPSPTAFVVDRWQFLCQSGIGAVAIPGMIQRERFLARKEPLLGGAFFPPVQGEKDRRGKPFESIDTMGNVVTHPDELAKWQHDTGFLHELGTIFTVIAGLLNLLVVYDAHSGPLVVEHPDKRKSTSNTSHDSPSEKGA